MPDDLPEYWLSRAEVTAHARVYMQIVVPPLPLEHRTAEILTDLLVLVQGGAIINSDTLQGVINATDWCVCEACYAAWVAAGGCAVPPSQRN